jgi:hypothetical protein
MESIFLVLSGVIVLVGILYWFWSLIQLTQKKVQLLENAVFELRSLMSKPMDVIPLSAPSYQDLGDDDWKDDAPIPVPESEKEIVQEEAPAPVPVPEDLRPGGTISQLESEAEVEVQEFKEMFTVDKSPESLDSMSLRELRRLAEQRGISGASDMRKRDILAALRQMIVAPVEEKVIELKE